MSNLGQGYWECRRVEGTHTRDKGGKDKSLSLHTCSEFSPVFSSQRCCQFIRVKLNLNGAYRGLSMACVKSGVVFPECRSTVSVLHSRPQLLPSPNSHWICWSVWGLTGCGLARRLWNACLRSQNGGVGAEICLRRDMACGCREEEWGGLHAQMRQGGGGGGGKLMGATSKYSTSNFWLKSIHHPPPLRPQSNSSRKAAVSSHN